MSLPIGSTAGVAMLLAGNIYLVWPWFTYSVLRLFDQSMHRANVKPAHVLRCAIYSGDAGFVIGCLIHACRRGATWFVQAVHSRRRRAGFYRMEVVLIAAVAFFAVLTRGGWPSRIGCICVFSRIARPSIADDHPFLFATAVILLACG